jgi:hypothetical protein
VIHKKPQRGRIGTKLWAILIGPKITACLSAEMRMVM